mgnify:CR=1 FL=1
MFGVVTSAIVGTTDLDTSPLGFLSASFCTTFTSASFVNGASNATSHLPSCPTVVVFLVPSGNVTSIVAPATPVPLTFVSSVSTLSTVGAPDVSLSTATSAPGSVSTDSSGYVIVTSPLSATSTFVFAGKSGFAFLTSSATFAFSSSVNFAGSSTLTLFSGAFGVTWSAVVGTTDLDTSPQVLYFLSLLNLYNSTNILVFVLKTFLQIQNRNLFLIN